MEKRLILFLILSAAIFLVWPYLFLPKPVPPNQQNQTNQIASTTTSPSPASTSTPETKAPEQPAVRTAPATQAELRLIKIKTDHWYATLSNQGGVIVEWTMTRFTDGKPIDAPQGVNLVSADLSQKIGAPFRFHIPSDSALEKELNSAKYEVRNLPEQEVVIDNGEKREITFLYANKGVEATKTLMFKSFGYEDSSGFDFNFVANVKRNGNPVPVYVVIGPNFGDQNVKEISTYKHAPQLSYAIDGDVEREPSTGNQGVKVNTVAQPVTWAAVDDNYFALAIVPVRPVAASRLLNDNYVSIAVGLNQGELNHVYAGPKDISLLSRVSAKFGLAEKGSQLEDIVSYGILDFMRGMIKPIAQFMLKALRLINTFTHNFGWSIVVLTIALNMLFFPLRWKSSVTMKRAAALQPKMKDLQERMKKLDKNDPRMLDLQKEQLALMKEGNFLMGCLPLLLQMPFFMAVFAILTVSIEVRNAHFFGWITDLSSKDPIYVLPIIMCITMIAQTALTPSTADPLQKKMMYVMPVVLTVFFFFSAPAGLVLYWMVSNLVGVAQQYVINRLTPTPPTAQNSSGDDQTGKKHQKPKKTREAVAN
jgi:YidC/Oxa1 family membrane protein insertase